MKPRKMVKKHTLNLFFGLQNRQVAATPAAVVVVGNVTETVGTVPQVVAIGAVVAIVVATSSTVSAKVGGGISRLWLYPVLFC